MSKTKSIDMVEILGSSNIKSAGYNKKAKVMRIVFKRNNRVYDYYQVPKRVFEGIFIAESAGVYFHKLINGNYAYKHIK